jgi:metalloendopeptidase OMA1, mitochondrial
MSFLKPRETTMPKTTSAALRIVSLGLLLPVLCLAQAPEEIKMGLDQQTQILAKYQKEDNDASNQIIQRAFKLLMETPTRAAGPQLPYEVTIIRAESINAFTTPGGKIYVHSGMTPLIGNSLGLAAAIVGHELGHSLGQHIYKAYLRAVDEQSARSALGSLLGAYHVSQNTISAADVSSKMGLGLVNLKLSRNDESEADLLGMKMMAEAGIHPDFAVDVFRQLSKQTGDKSSLATFFFSNHPRNITRQERLLKAQGEALEIFQSRYPDAALSPGGLPPVIGTIGASATEDKRNKAAVVKVSLKVRNASGQQGAIRLRLQDKDRDTVVTSDAGEFRTEGGEFGSNRSFTIESANYESNQAISIPTDAIAGKRRDLLAVLTVFVGDDAVDETSIVIKFPK